MKPSVISNIIVCYSQISNTIYIHCGSSLRNSQTRLFRKPDVCPVSEAKFRKPVLAGLRSNNEMNLFGFRRCYRSPQRGSGSRSSISPDYSAFPAQCGLSRCRVRVSADVLRGGTVVAARCPRLHRPPPPSPPQPWYIQLISFQKCKCNIKVSSQSED